MKKYWKTNKNFFSEEYFSVVFYYTGSIPGDVSNTLLKNRAKYEELYGDIDVRMILFFLAMGKFEKAILNKSQKEFDNAIEFTKKADTSSGAEITIQYFKKPFLITQNKWSEVLIINEALKAKKQFSDNAINSFSWDVYKKCTDQNVIIKCVQWMKELVNRKPDYACLDTYARVLHKSGDKVEAKRIAELAIEIGKKNNENTSSTEKFLSTFH